MTPNEWWEYYCLFFGRKHITVPTLLPAESNFFKQMEADPDIQAIRGDGNMVALLFAVYQREVINGRKADKLNRTHD